MILGRCGVAAVVGYVGLCFVSQTVRVLGPQRATVERLAVLPLPGWGPVQWRGIAVTRSSYLVSRVTLVPPNVPPPEVIAKGPDTPLVCALRTSGLVRLFWTVPTFPWSKSPNTTPHSSYAMWTCGPRATDAPGPGLPSWCVSIRRATREAIEFLNRLFLPTSPDF